MSAASRAILTAGGGQQGEFTEPASTVRACRALYMRPPKAT
ncbi:hypothetical protein [Ruegeria pomeroyi]|nr:hypothetical protein [Ruegeria pomeroyi]